MHARVRGEREDIGLPIVLNRAKVAAEMSSSDNIAMFRRLAWA